MANFFIILCLCLAAVALTTKAYPAFRVPKGYTFDHFTVFWQDRLNFTDFILLPGLPHLGTGITPVSGPYGTMIVYDDPVTTTPDFCSKVIGSIRGTGSVCKLDGLSTFSSEIDPTKEDVAPISGGTGDFLFAQGFAVTTPLDVRTTNTTYSVELAVFWPPFY